MVIAREETPCRSGRVKLDRVGSAVPVGFATPGRDPRSLALPDWQTLRALADALVTRSADGFRGWGDVVIFAAGTVIDGQV